MVLVLSSFVLLFTIAFAVIELPIAYPANLSNFAQAMSVELVAVMPPTWQTQISEYFPQLLDLFLHSDALCQPIFEKQNLQ